MEAKKRLRKEIKNLLNNLDSKLERDQHLSLQLLNWLKSQNFYSNDLVIGAYAPLPEEANYLVSLGDVEKSRLAFPAIDEFSTMVFKSALPEELIESEEFKAKLRTPPKDAMKVFPDLLLVPGLAFNLSGERLGRGKGFYDKFLETFKGEKIGICFECQLIKDIPTEIHDQKCDWLITEKNIYKCK